jgi:hypothetical protein
LSVVVLVLVPLLSLAAPARAAAQPAPAALPPVCSALFQQLHPAECPNVGPGQYAMLLEAAGLPYPLPTLPVTPTAPLGALPRAYAQIITSTAPVWRHPYEAVAGLPPVRHWETGYDFASVLGEVVVNGQTFVQINANEFMRAEHLQPVRPSGFAGRALAEPPGAPVGWLINTVPASPAPGAAPDAAAPILGRYTPFTLLGAERVGDWNWYQVFPGQWVEQRNVALVQPHPPGGAGGTLVAVDTYEQSLGVYVDGRLIYATLISSGSRYFPTRPGTFQVWARLDQGKMSGAYLKDRRDFYYLEDVPYILYYDGDRALHGAYWHDKFGSRTSHGCVNLSPRDARWLFDFARVGTTVIIFASG